MVGKRKMGQRCVINKKKSSVSINNVALNLKIMQFYLIKTIISLLHIWNHGLMFSLSLCLLFLLFLTFNHAVPLFQLPAAFAIPFSWPTLKLGKYEINTPNIFKSYFKFRDLYPLQNGILTLTLVWGTLDP